MHEKCLSLMFRFVAITSTEIASGSFEAPIFALQRKADVCSGLNHPLIGLFSARRPAVTRAPKRPEWVGPTSVISVG
jgi:hypothetical protein